MNNLNHPCNASQQCSRRPETVGGGHGLGSGGVLLPGLAVRIETAADIAAVVVEDPLRCVIRSAAHILEGGIAGPEQLAA